MGTRGDAPRGTFEKVPLGTPQNFKKGVVGYCRVFRLVPKTNAYHRTTENRTIFVGEGLAPPENERNPPSPTKNAVTNRLHTL